MCTVLKVIEAKPLTYLTNWKFFGNMSKCKMSIDAHIMYDEEI